ncbi:MAG TPA: DNA-3-methyladenine glycosylase [Gaiellaceae bacterium]|nr:DNA-3-methyladenine glycosylase [Gaiellaceae bacterium]
MKLSTDFFARSVHEVAPDLVGATLLVDGVGGRLVEVEAYAVGDPASHGYKGRTPSRESMFGPPGRAYVYRSYGVHWCLNFVCGEEGSPEAVLIRALEPLAGAETMAARRGVGAPRLLCAGPGRLTQALGLTGAHDGLPLDEPPFELHGRNGAIEVAACPRIGLTVAAEEPWRYVLAGSRFVSRPVPRRRR